MLSNREPIYVTFRPPKRGDLGPMKVRTLRELQDAAHLVDQVQAGLAAVVKKCREQRIQDRQIAEALGIDRSTLRYRYGTRKGTSGRYENRTSTVVRVPIPRVPAP